MGVSQEGSSSVVEGWGGGGWWKRNNVVFINYSIIFSEKFT